MSLNKPIWKLRDWKDKIDIYYLSENSHPETMEYLKENYDKIKNDILFLS